MNGARARRSTTPASPRPSPAARTAVSRSPLLLIQASRAPIAGTDAMSRPLAELGNRRSAEDKSAHGTMISISAYATSQCQFRRSSARWDGRHAPWASATGTRMSAPMTTRDQTSTGTATAPSATLISRYGIPQMIPITTKRTVPRLLKNLPSAGPDAAAWFAGPPFRQKTGTPRKYSRNRPSVRLGPTETVPPIIVVTSVGETTEGLGCRCARVGIATSRNSPVVTPRSSAGARVAVGCSRMMASTCPTVDRTRSATTAIASCPEGNRGPQPLRASWRSRRSTAFRCVAVSPGWR